jgi:hypothetical protein
MRTFLFFSGSALGSVAFQASVALYPQYLQQWAWAVKWVWLTWAGIWFLWLVTHPNVFGAVLRKADLPDPLSPTHVEATGGNATATGGNVNLYLQGIPVPSSSSIPDSAKPPIRERKYNLASGGIFGIVVVEDRECLRRSMDLSQFQIRLPAIVIEITNDAHEDFDVDPASSIIAGLKIKDLRESFTLSPLPWLNNRTGIADIYPGRSQNVVLAVRDSYEKWHIPLFNGGGRSIDWTTIVPKEVPSFDADLNISLSNRGRIVFKVPLRWTWHHEAIHIMQL